MIRWYMLYSYWILVLAGLYAVGLQPISTFPSSLLALPFGVFFVYQKYRVDPNWKLGLAFLLHFVPFMIVPWILTKNVLLWNFLFLWLYVVFMTLAEADIVQTYKKTYYEIHTNLKDFAAERAGF